MSESESKNHKQQAAMNDRLKNVRVGIRSDLEVTRHVFNNTPAYIIRDPLTFRSFKLDAKGYSIFTAINRHKALGEIFDELVKNGTLSLEDEDKFYRLVFMLHSLNFLNLPVSDNAMLYKRYVAKKRALLKSRIFGIMFMKVPFFNPDAFLNATIRYVNFIFTKWFFAIWLTIIALAIFIIIKNSEQFFAPIHNSFIFKHIIYIWAILIVLKVFHEFGHAYACKHFGGYVPEMGAFFVMFTPLAYVNATAAWSFPRKRDRIIVAMGGMYIELIFAAIAVFVWFTTAPGFVHSIAYYIVFLAGIATLLFNINPLARFDGYYALSDWLEIPNLRGQATQYIASLFKKTFLGITKNNLFVPLKTKIILLTFGIASIIYRTTVILAIGLTAAWKFAIFGLILSAMFLFSYFGTKIYRFAKYLLCSEETQPVRTRAVAFAVIIFIVAPIIMFTIPFPNVAQPAGVIEAQDEFPVCAKVDGFLEQINIVPGQKVNKDTIIAKLRNDDCVEAFTSAETNYRVSNIRYDAYQNVDIAKAVQERELMKSYLFELKQKRRDLENLTVKAGFDGLVLQSLLNTDTGRYIRKGQPIALISNGNWQVQAVLSEHEFATIKPKIGDKVRVKVLAKPSYTFVGAVKRIVPGGTKDIDDNKLNLTEIAGGDIAVNPKTKRAEQTYFEVTIALPLNTGNTNWLKSGMSCQVWYSASPETIGSKLYKKLSLAMNKILQVK